MFYKWSDIENHNTKDDAWIVISGEVFDVTNFIKEHTGGCMPLYAAGKDVTHLFRTIHSTKADEIISRKIKKRISYSKFLEYGREKKL